MVRCPRDGTEMIYDNGVLVCPRCGFILDEPVLSESPDYRQVSQSSSKGTADRSMVSNDNLRHDQGIGVSYLNAPRSRSPLKRVMKLRSKISKAHPLLRGEAPKVSVFEIAKRAASHFELSESAKQALGTILQAYVNSAKGPIGRDANKVVAAALRKVVQMYNIAISQSEIEEFFDINDNDLWEGLRKLYDSGALSPAEGLVDTSGGAKRLLERSSTYINRITSTLNLPPIIGQQALEFIRKSLEVTWKTPYGKRPEAIAAASVYLVARLHGYEVSQSDVAKVVGIKESTVRKLYRFLMDGMVVLVDV